MAPMNFVVGLYLINKEFGGSEEGGWWYTAGTLERTLKVFTTEQAADAWAYRYNTLLKKWVNRGRKRDIGSVCCTGAYQARVEHLVLPLRFPAVHPHYE